MWLHFLGGQNNKAQKSTSLESNRRQLDQPTIRSLDPDEKIDLGGGTIFTHFTNKEGIEGITKINTDSMEIGDRFLVSRLDFRRGETEFLAKEKGNIFVTDLPSNASSGKLMQIGVFKSTCKQDFVI